MNAKRRLSPRRPSTRRSRFGAGLALACVCAALPSQQHARSPLILGNTATFTASSPAGLFALFAFSGNGLGFGGCVPSVGCLGVLPPVTLGPLVGVDADGVCRFSFVIPAALPPGPLASQALLLEPGAFVVSGALDGPVEPLSAFDDEFSGGGLSGDWQLHNPALLQYAVGGGELHVQPVQGGPAATWYGSGEGPMAYRIVRGDFTVTAQVRSYRLSDPSLPPLPDYNMAGLTVRDPLSAPGANDWLHVAVGGGVPSAPVVVEDKSTDDSVSDLLLHPIAAPQGQVRITRQGALVSLYYRSDAAAAWQLLRAHARPDLGPELMVGPNCFSWSPGVDVGASFAWVRFTRP